MYKNLSSIFGLIILTFAFNVLAPLSVSAQTQEELRMQYVMNPDTNIEEFRTEMKNYLTDLENALTHFEAFPAVRAQYEKNGINPAVALRLAKANLDKISAEDLVKMRATYAKFPGWREGPRVIYNISQKLLEKNANKKSDGNTSNVITPDACPDLSGTPSFADIAITKGFEIAADAVMEALPTDVLTILAREASVVARAGLKAAVLAEETLRSQYDDCHGLSSTDVTGIVDGAKTEIINNDNNNKTMIVNNDNSNATTLNTAITNARNTIVNNDNSNKTMITTAITDAQTSINNTSTGNTTTITNGITNSKNEIISNDNSNRTTIINNDNSNAATLNNNLTVAKNMIIANDNTNTTNIVNNANANTTILNTAITNAKNQILADAQANKTELRDLLLRSQIEADLAEESNGVKVAWYLTPTA